MMRHARFQGELSTSTHDEEVSSHYKDLTRKSGAYPDHVRQEFEEALSMMGDSDAATINTYTRDVCYQEVNHALRTDDPVALTEHGGFIYDLKRALWRKGKMVGFFTGMCSRGMTVNSKSLEDFKKLAAQAPCDFLFAGFVSSTRGSQPAFDGNVMLEIDCSQDPVGTSAVHIAEWSAYPDEDEVLFFPFSGFTIVGSREEKEVLILSLVMKERALIDADHMANGWRVYRGRNCYTGHGGVNLDNDEHSTCVGTIKEAKAMCDGPAAVGFTYQVVTGRTWRLREITDCSSFRSNPKFDVYWKKNGIWEHHPGKNCYTGHGGTNLDNDERSQPDLTVDQGKAWCDGPAAVGFTYDPSTKRVWRLREITDVSAFRKNPKYQVHMKLSA
mmetsp:Transcript_10144/g.16915  ORF Transcript_10144/g.16915 Transcript_10144/m.16915 type:complete len:386 (-) Transcript_10144:66-1223(-)